MANGYTFTFGKKIMDPEQLEAVMQRCFRLFPIESFVWGGATFTRGNNLRIVTNANQLFEGKFMGLNNDNMVCLLTEEMIITQQVSTITEIHLV